MRFAVHAMKPLSPILSILLTGASLSVGQVPQMINYQGRVAVNGTNFDGTGQFKFAIVDGTGATTHWSNGVGTIAVPVTKGLYSVLLGDGGMNPLPGSVFSTSDVRLRVWFDDGANGLQQLSPDQRIAAVAYAMMAGDVPDGLITADKLAAGSVGRAQLAASLANGIVPWQVGDGLTPLASANTGYLLTNAGLTTIFLPTTANVGDVVRVSGAGAGGWEIARNIDQAISGYSAPLTFSTWVPHVSGEAWYGMASDFDGSTLVAAAAYGGRIWVSTDSGTNWTAHESAGTWLGAASSADGTKLAAVKYGGQIYTSSDSGTNWTARENTRGWNGIASSADGTRLAATVSAGQIYVSTDSGVTWAAREQIRNWSSIASSADGTKLAATVSAGQIYTSTDGGTNWTARDSNRNWTQMASSADGSKLAVAVSGDRIYTSSDAGVTWTPRGETGNWHYVASSGDGNRLIANDHATSGRIYISVDAGRTWVQRENARFWRALAVSGDGNMMVATVDRGAIYTSAASPGTNVAGAQGTTATLQYLGNGLWQPLNESLIGAGAVGSAQLAAGAVGSAQLADNAVTSSAIATGAVTSAQIANGAVDAAQLAKPPRSGSIPSSALTIMFHCATTNVTFGVPFNTTPTVTLALETGDSTIADGSSLVMQNRTNTGFAVRWRNNALPVTLDSGGDVGWETSLAYLGSGSKFPAISYRDRLNGDLKFIAAQNSIGTMWMPPVNVTTNGNVGYYSSLIWLPGYGVPAISYCDITSMDLKFVRAASPQGTFWGTPVTVDSLNDVGPLNSLILLGNSRPAIAYYDANYGDLKFVWSNDTGGNSWSVPVYVDSNATVNAGVPSSAMVSGKPAILYLNGNNNDLLYTRANDSTGAVWAASQVVANGTAPSLAVVNGRPAFCHNNSGSLCYQRAADPTGSVWNAAIVLDTVAVAPRSMQLAVVGGKPAVSYYDSANGDLKYVFAQDADGTLWNAPVTVDGGGTVGQYNSLAEVSGSPAISYYDASNGDLKFVRHRSAGVFTINWIAIEP